MRARILVIALLASLPAFAACDDAISPLRLGVAGTIPGAGVGDTVNVARIRFVNATAATTFDVLQDGILTTGNSALRFGMSSNCVIVAASSSVLDVRQTGTSVTFPGFDLTLQGAGRFTVVAFTDVTGATRFVTLFNSFRTLNGQAAFAVFNAVSTGVAFDVFVTPPGALLNTTSPTVAAVLGGVNTGFVGVDATTTQRILITTANATTVVLDVGNVTLLSDVSTILVIAPPLPGSTQIRAFLVAGC